MRMSIKHPLRKLSNENWKRYGKMRYKIGHRFSSIKQKIGSSFNLLRGDWAQKAFIACAVLWNLYLFATSVCLFLLSCILCYNYAKTAGGFLEQPQALKKSRLQMFFSSKPKPSELFVRDFEIVASNLILLGFFWNSQSKQVDRQHVFRYKQR
jgi:hypothetical protein